MKLMDVLVFKFGCGLLLDVIKDYGTAPFHCLLAVKKTGFN